MTTAKKVLLAGEGRNELGSWADEPQYRKAGMRGVLEALLGMVRRDGWRISDALVWKRIPKFRQGDHRGAEERQVLGLVLQAKERKFDLVVFSRDRDGDKPETKKREADVRRALETVHSVVPGAPPVVGAVAIERLESWLLALAGRSGSESMRRSAVDAALRNEHQIGEKETAAMVALVERATRSSIPEDATSLHEWIEQAEKALG